MKTVKFELSSPNKYGNHNTYRITSVLKAKTDIIASIAASPTGRAVIMYVPWNIRHYMLLCCMCSNRYYITTVEPVQSDT
jgi:hypothetical protein